ncbi:DDE-type integrase/transposase/recombinase [Chromobacterium haemolyticum]|uniref:DDE-type integrase/transposase/recombinase n=1 Tax=Chromobacterium haemolyticum TaxID=394935 RepID=UPI004055E6AF
MVNREGVRANHKRVYRLYREAGLMVRRRKQRHGVAVEREPLERPDRSNAVWSMDFVSDALANGRRIKVINIVDDFSKECVAVVVDYGISGHYVVRTEAGRPDSGDARPRSERIRAPNLPAMGWTSGTAARAFS